MSLDWRQTLSLSGGVVAMVSIVAALAVGFGLLPSAAEVKRIGETVEKVSQAQEGRGRRVASVEKDTAVQAQQIENIEKTVQRIEATQSAQFERMMNKLDKIDRRRR